MADTTDNKTISKSKTGFPDYLDFQKLRSSAIAYLGNLSGNIWTDHNVHDPGITTLESIIYAILDLGYRTNLPINDLLARNPNDTSTDNNFFTPAEILACNPLTIIDFRKMLVDCEGIKNAWLEIDANTPVEFCPDPAGILIPGGVNGSANFNDPCSCDYLNGLYHVYIQLENNVLTNKHRQEKVVHAVKQKLMTHRNLCEDFIDIQVLCTLDVGICADIELESNADAGTVYLKMVSVLLEYFSPSPKFYSLQQLLDKNKSIDDIYAGRPLDTKEGHGFIDTNELEKLQLRRELHLSDIYHLLFDITGIKGVRNLRWLQCAGEVLDVNDWKLKIPQNYVTEFSYDCSGFSFSRNDIPVNIDLKKYASFLKLNFSDHQKVLYSADSPTLNAAFPICGYRSDLADYYALAKDFPNTYGIGEGGLPTDATDARKAQALQLQGFLLFFDQLLVNYLAQLKNIRSLFALSTEKTDDKHTYFSQPLSNTPQLDKLLRFKSNEDGSSILGDTGTTLAYLTDRKKIQDFIDNNASSSPAQNCYDCQEDEFPIVEFCFAAVRDQVEHQLMDDLLNGNIQIGTTTNTNGQFFFYIFISSSEYGLISKKFYKSETDARLAASSIQYTATFEGNYRNFMITKDDCSQRFSFDIVLNITSYADFLHLIVENKELYINRRQDFLKHLMARFAETFADYALLSSGFLTGQDLEEANIQAGENFLTHYPDISSNRGKASNYTSYKWGNANVSGFEKRFKALAGIKNLNRHYLCNFIVEQADKLYELSIQLFDKKFVVENQVFNEEQAIIGLQAIYKALKNPVFEVAYISYEEKWNVTFSDDLGHKLVGKELFSNKVDAELFGKKLTAITHFEPDLHNDIEITQYIHKVLFTNNQNVVIAESNTHFVNKDEAEAYRQETALRLNYYLNGNVEFTIFNKRIKSDKLINLNMPGLTHRFIDEHEFRFKPFDVIHLDLEKKKYSVVNKAATLQFDSLLEFDNLKLARDSFKELVLLLSNEINYKVDHPKKEDEEFSIFIEQNGEKKAIYFENFPSKDAALKKIKDLIQIINNYTYNLYVSDPIADEWEFLYRSSDLSNQTFTYISTGHFNSLKAASDAAITFYQHLPQLTIKAIDDDKWVLALESEPLKIDCVLKNEIIRPDDINIARNDLNHSRELLNRINKTATEDLITVIEKNRINPGEDFIYKLVDKDNLQALHPATTAITDEATAENIKNELITLGLSAYISTDIDVSGGNIRVRIDIETGISWYHFLIRSNVRKYTKGELQNQLLVYFESTRGYLSSDEALKAFDQFYLLILKYGRHPKSYGQNQWISLKEIFIHNSDPYGNSKSIAFVPGETVYEYDGLDIPKKLVALSSACPIQYLGKNKYRFQLCRIDEATFTCIIDWRSKRYYATDREAIYANKAFHLLLLYSGNYIVIWDSVACVFRIAIREVLAISTHGFATPEDAWGIEGVEKFICVSQSNGGFHTYLNKPDCSNSFYVACNNIGLIHPCVYETPERRDAVMERLYRAATFSFFNLVHTVSDDFIVLTDLEQIPLVQINFPKREMNFSPCKWLVIFFKAVFLDDHYKRMGNKLHLIYYDVAENVNYTLAESLPDGISLKEWKLQLKRIAQYFPISEIDVDCGTITETRYSVTIRLPGFGGMELGTGDPCKNKDNDDCIVGCDIAWKSDCCFESCCEALNFYAQSFDLLRSFENYKPVYDCPCGSYRIELVPLLSLKGKELLLKREHRLAATLNAICFDTNRHKLDNQNIGEQGVLTCFNEIIAINPQHYKDEAMACDAVLRAENLINAEGLHLIEHILLRPRCKDQNDNYKECACDGLPKPCITNDETCHFKWKPTDDADPCKASNQTCFTPGCDPYSFIATIVLPAWPARFRQDHSRAYIEKMLYRETPAHVMIRILWLTPQDLCQLEKLLIAWNVQLSGKNCMESTASCDLQGFLLKEQHNILNKCKDCMPCPCTTDVSQCISETEDKCDQINFSDKLNQLFCWSANS